MESSEHAPYSPPPGPSAPPADAAMPRSVTLASATDLDGFRAACRQLWAEQVEPGRVSWHAADDPEADLFEAATPPLPPSLGKAPPVHVPGAFLPLCEHVVLHRDPNRFGLLYRLLWRLQAEPALRHDALDAEMQQARRMANAVRHEIHKMHAFVRFRAVARGAGEPPLHVAWFEPVHHVVDAAAPFFVGRFANMPWALLTPERSLRWDGETLESGPGASRADAPPADAGEALWLTYYESIFNPARLKLRTMAREMPRRYWRNLPETAAIGALAGAAVARSGAMVERPPQPPARRMPASTAMPLAVVKPPVELPPKAGVRVRAQVMQEQRDAASVCRECPIGFLATQTVWGEGPVTAPLMFVGEQPGDQEDLQGRPFVGPAGKLLDRALAQLGWDRSIAYVTNAVKHFKYEPRGKRRIHKTPAQREADACQHWMESEIALVRPRAIVALGATAARQLMGTAVAVTRERGRWLERSDGRKVLITLHPSALLRVDPEDKAAAYAAWLADLKQAARHFAASDK
jgi:probable DNA metabolism protein